MTPELIIIAGPNGAGKTTFATKFLTILAPNHLYLNVDELARIISTTDSTDFGAAKIHLMLFERYLNEKRDMIVESTLSGLGYLRKIKRAKELGYWTMMHYLELPDVETSLARVKRRVEAGGHDVPESDIRRRFDRSKRNFKEKYKPLVHSWWHYLSNEGEFVFLDKKLGRY